MKPILVHVHIYYQEMWEELKSCLKNIAPYPYDLHVTMVQDHQDLKKDILYFNQKANIQIFENRGFDVAPFVEVLNQVNLDDYSYIVKLHTKRNIQKSGVFINTFDVSGSKWRDYLLSFIKTKENFQKSIEILQRDKSVGMISDFRLITKFDPYDKKAKKGLNDLIKKHHFSKISYEFVAGTMFMVRASIFEPIKKMKINVQDFSLSSTVKKSQLAHIMERFFGYLVYLSGQEIVDPITPKKEQKMPFLKMQHYLRKIAQFFYYKKIKENGVTSIKVLRLPMPTTLMKKIGIIK